VPPTRFSAKPTFRNTFVNFQQDKGHPGFISETDRIGGRRNGSISGKGESGHSVFAQTVTNNLNAKVAFQSEEKFRNSMRQEANMAMKRENQERITN